MSRRACLCFALLKVLDSYRSVTSIWCVYVSRSPVGDQALDQPRVGWKRCNDSSSSAGPGGRADDSDSAGEDSQHCQVPQIEWDELEKHDCLVRQKVCVDQVRSVFAKRLMLMAQLLSCQGILSHCSD